MEHIVINGENLHISKGLAPIFNYLSTIEQEIEANINYQKDNQLLKNILSNVLNYLAICTKSLVDK